MIAKYLYIVQKFITFFIENICFTRIKGLPLRHDSKTLILILCYEA